MNTNQSSEKKLRENLGSHASINLLAKFSLRVLSVVLLKILTLTLTKEGYGIYSLWFNFALVMASLSYGPFVSSIWRFLQKVVSERKENGSALLATSVVGGVIAWFVIYFILLITDYVFDFGLVQSSSHVGMLFVAGVLALAYVFMRVVLAVSGAEQNSKEIIIYNLLFGLFANGTAIYCAYLIPTPIAVIFGLAIGRLIPVSFVMLLKIRQYGITAPQLVCLKRIIKYGLPDSIGSILNTAVPFFAIWILSLLGSAEDAALLAIALSVGSLLSGVMNPILTAYQAYIVRSYELGNFGQGNIFTRLIFKQFSALSTLGVWMMIVFSPFLVNLVSTSEYLSSTNLIALAAPSAAVLVLSNFWKLRLNLKEKTKEIAMIYAAAMLGLILLSIILVPQIGRLGSGISIIANSLIVFVLMYRLGNRELPMGLGFRPFIAWIISVISMVLGYLVSICLLASNILSALISIATYLIAAFTTKLLTYKELRTLISNLFGKYLGH